MLSDYMSREIATKQQMPFPSVKERHDELQSQSHNTNRSSSFSIIVLSESSSMRSPVWTSLADATSRTFCSRQSSVSANLPSRLRAVAAAESFSFCSATCSCWLHSFAAANCHQQYNNIRYNAAVKGVRAIQSETSSAHMLKTLTCK